MSISRADKGGFANWWFTVDKVALTGMGLLLGIGLMLAFAASPAITGGPLTAGDFHYAARQLMYATVALSIMAGASLLSLRQVKIAAAFIFAAALIGSFLVLFFGSELLGARRELDSDFIACRDGAESAMELHGTDAVADLESQLRIHIERDMLGHLADDACEFSGGHLVGRIVHVPELDEDLRPGLGIGAAVETCEFSRFHFRHMIAAADGLAIIVEGQPAFWMVGEAAQQFADRHIVHDIFIASASHLGYSSFLYF